MSSPPYIPLYIADYLADTQHFSAAEHGAYLLLIMAYWRDDGLPADEKRLARIACMTAAEWKKAASVIREKFTPDWRHRRIDIELAKATEKHAKRVAAGQAGGKQKASNASSNSLPFSSISDSSSGPSRNENINHSSLEPRPVSVPAFPSDGTISYSEPWAEISRKAAPGIDPDVMASAFRKMRREKDQSLVGKDLPAAFSGFCKAHRTTGAH